MRLSTNTKFSWVNILPTMLHAPSSGLDNCTRVLLSVTPVCIMSTAAISTTMNTTAYSQLAKGLRGLPFLPRGPPLSRSSWLVVAILSSSIGEASDVAAVVSASLPVMPVVSCCVVLVAKSWSSLVRVMWPFLIPPRIRRAHRGAVRMQTTVPLDQPRTLSTS